MRTISEIYTEYKIMPNLQKHMLRVAAVASLICDNFPEPLPKEDIITACLLHDMGNIIKSDLEYFSEFNEPEGIEHWKKVKNEFIDKYGNDEYGANKKIAKEIGLSEEIINIIDKDRFTLACHNRDGKDVGVKIIQYSDYRVSPFEVLSYEERMMEAKKRYENKKDTSFTEEEYQRLVACGKEIEKQIFAKCKIKPEDINDENIAPIISELRNFMIHSTKTQAFGSEAQARRDHGE